MPHIQRKDRPSKFLPQVLDQALGSIEDNLHVAVAARRKAPSRRLGPSPCCCRPPARERRPHFLVDRSMQQSVHPAPECIHDNDHGLPTVLALVSFATTFLAAVLLPLFLAAMSLTAMRTRAPRTTTFGQLFLRRCRRTLAVLFDDQNASFL